MIHRTFDPVLIRTALDRHEHNRIDLDEAEWIADKDNVALTDDEGNVGMLHLWAPRVFSGHYFFECRGKAAKQLSIQMLREAFTTYGAEVVQGLTPLFNRPALWMSRHLGFKSLGEVDTWVGPCVIFMMTKDEFMARHGEVE